MSVDLRIMSRNFIREFIELYKQHPCLWQVKSKDYLNKNKKERAYQLLIHKLQTVDPSANKNSVLTKINTLRGGFRRTYKRIQESKKSGSPDDVYVPSLWYYDLLLFTKDQDIEINEEAEYEEQFQKYEEDNSMDRTEEEVDSSYEEPLIYLKGQIKDNTMSPLLLNNQSPTPSLHNEGSRKRKNSPLLDKTDDIIDVMSLNSEDEFSIIGKNVAFKLRRLPPETKLYTEKLINDLLFQAELGNVNQHTKISVEEV